MGYLELSQESPEKQGGPSNSVFAGEKEEQPLTQTHAAKDSRLVSIMQYFSEIKTSSHYY